MTGEPYTLCNVLRHGVFAVSALGERMVGTLAGDIARPEVRADSEDINRRAKALSRRAPQVRREIEACRAGETWLHVVIGS